MRGGGSGVQRETHLRRSFGVRRPVGWLTIHYRPSGIGHSPSWPIPSRVTALLVGSCAGTLLITKVRPPDNCLDGRAMVGLGSGGTAEVDRFEIADEIGRYDLDKFFHKHSLIGTKLCDGVLSPTRRSRGTELPGTLMGTDRTLFARVG